MAAMLTGAVGTSRAEGPEKKKVKRTKKSTPKEKAEATIPDLAGATAGDAPGLSEKQAPKFAPPPCLPEEVAIIDESSLGANKATPGQQAQEIPSIGIESHVKPATTMAHPPRPTRRMDEAATETAPHHRVTEGSDPRIPFCHKLGEISKQRWKELRAKLIGDLEEGYLSKEDPSEDERFTPSHFLHQEDSVLLSGRAQLIVTDQFSHPKDLDLLKEVPTRGLRLALQSYSIRGTLIGEELFDRFDYMMQAYGELTGEIAQEKKAREEAEKRITALEAERSGVDAKWCRELEMRQSAIVDLQTHKSKQSATIAKLKEEIAKLGATVESFQQEVTERGKRIEHLEETIEAERRAKLVAQESARSDQLALQNLKVELEEARAAHQMALADVQSIETRLKYMTSEEGRREVIEGYRHGPVGKVELSLAVKTGCDYLKAQLPPNALSSPGPVYPPRVQSCLNILQDIEARGGGVQLGANEGDDDEDDEDDDDDDDDGDDLN